ncbi:efflux RND transporter periplasmic adaptor subunit [Paraburkholderia phymatum]|uniref:Efflux RND transporter periplasmic adaptor subunit n=1 Tax=Paraburkholderia phymatum TaxID=148447 RepID=A0ACC6U387_9BURK
MKNRFLFWSAGTLALAARACWTLYQALYPNASATAAAAQTVQQSTVQTVNGETVIVVSAAAQRASHIEATRLAALTVRPERTAYASVVDLQPLFDLRTRLAAARADLDTFTAQAGNSRTQYERNRVLFDDDRNVSQKSLQDARAAMQADEAKRRSAEATVSGLDATMRQQFGDALADSAMAPSSRLFQRLLAGREIVLRVTLPFDYAGTAPANITIDTPDGQAVPAQKLSASPSGDPSVQGNPWFYAMDRALPVGTRTSARVPSSAPATPAIVIPERAVVWYGGQAWSYVQTAPDRFTRRYVPADNEGDQGFVVTSGFHAGDAVVTQGAQLLLSEELKPQGIATACKDPPECDD